MLLGVNFDVSKAPTIPSFSFSACWPLNSGTHVKEDAFTFNNGNNSNNNNNNNKQTHILCLFFMIPLSPEGRDCILNEPVDFEKPLPVIL